MEALLDFRPVHHLYLDTGAGNYELLYKFFDRKDYELDVNSIVFNPREHIGKPDTVQHYNIIDRVWMHMGASSHDQLAGVGSYKLAYTKGFLDCALLAADKSI